MKLEDFEKLSTDAQLSILYRKGIYVDKRELNGKIALLYQLDVFYTEIIYKEYRSVVDEIKITESIKILELYLPATKLKI